MKTKHLFWLSVVGLLLLAGCERATTPVTLPAMISDNMVFQRDAPLPLWGQTLPNAKVRVGFQNKSYRTKADADGNWSLLLDSYAAGGPYELTINETTLKNILIGDVWVCSGQSNMEWPLTEASNCAQVLAGGGNSNVRLFMVENMRATEVQSDVVSYDRWQVSTPETMEPFSAVGYLFADEVQKTQHVPIGIIGSEWGGSPIEVWMRKGLFDRERQDEQAEKNAAWIAGQLELKAWQAEIDRLDNERLGGVDVTASNYDASDWQELSMPAYWEGQIFPEYDGIVYLRKDFTLEEIPTSATITVGCVDDKDETYINGIKVGSGEGYNKTRVYNIPDRVLNQGSNAIVIRVIDNGGNGGIRPMESLFGLNCDGVRLSLAGTWLAKKSLPFADFPPSPRVPHWEDSHLYNAMIAPLTRMPIKGVIWYQGESNVWDAAAYKSNFEAMVGDWRTRWGVGDFPFLYVQLANFKVMGEEDEKWAELRQSQLENLSIANTAMAVTIDIGDPGDIHPTNKKDVAHRLALGAQKMAYGKAVVHTGPLFQSAKLEGGRVLVSFDGVGGGLKSRSSVILNNFELADAQGRWHSSEARIEGDKVAIASPKVKNPVAVRYAWSSSPERVNFYNAEGLPASPFYGVVE